MLQHQALAENKSFLQQHEQQAINEALKIKEERESEENLLHLQGIVYIDANNWTIWVNGNSYNNDFPNKWPNLQLISVSADSIVLTKDGVQHTIEVGEKFSSRS